MSILSGDFYPVSFYKGIFESFTNAVRKYADDNPSLGKAYVQGWFQSGVHGMSYEMRILGTNEDGVYVVEKQGVPVEEVDMARFRKEDKFARLVGLNAHGCRVTYVKVQGGVVALQFRVSTPHGDAYMEVKITDGKDFGIGDVVVMNAPYGSLSRETDLGIYAFLDRIRQELGV